MSRSENYCCASVWQGYHAYHCGKRAKLFEEGKWYCGIHAPSVVAAREATTRARIDNAIRRVDRQCRIDEASRRAEKALLDCNGTLPARLTAARDALIAALNEDKK